MLSNFTINLMGAFNWVIRYSNGYETDLSKKHPWLNTVVGPLLELLQTIMLPLLIIVGVVGSIFVVILGVKFSKAETADKRDEAKKRMTFSVIGMVSMVGLLVIINLFTSNAPTVMGWILKDYSQVTQTETDKVAEGFVRVYFKDHDGKHLYQVDVAAEAVPTQPTEVPTREGYTHTGWATTMGGKALDTLPKVVKGQNSIAYYAVYTKNAAPSGTGGGGGAGGDAGGGKTPPAESSKE